MRSAAFSGFSEFLAHTLRVGTRLRVYHVSTPPTATTPIYTSPPGTEEVPTICESHFLAISQPAVPDHPNPSQNTVTSGWNEDTNDAHILVLGIEVLIFTNTSLTTIFVSKADSSGFLTRPKISGQGSSSLIRSVTAAFLEWLVSRELSPRTPEPSNVIRHEPVPPTTQNGTASNVDETSVPDPNPRKRRLVLSLFARSQNQYLFPGSIENATKHVLDDRQLIKWWCRVLEGLVQHDWSFTQKTTSEVTACLTDAAVSTSPNCVPTTAQHITCEKTPVRGASKVMPEAYVIVPGCDRAEVFRSFFPPSGKCPEPSAEAKWHNSYPNKYLIDSDTSQHILGTTATIPVRCMIPRLPDDPKARYCDDLDQAGIDDQGQWRNTRTLQQFWEAMEYRQECAAGRLVGFVWVTFGTGHTRLDAADSNVTIPNLPILGVPNGHVPVQVLSITADASTDGTLSSSPSPTSVVLSTEQYNTLADFLINDTDFAGPELAKKSTKDWITKVEELSGTTSFGVDIEGRAPMTPATLREDSGISMAHMQDAAAGKRQRPETDVPHINVLTGVKKKRKVEQESSNLGLT